MESLIEKTLYASRWILAPVYLGLSLLLLVLAVKFFQEFFHIIPELLHMPEQTLILKILSMVDLTLVASLVVMVMFSGYENFVSKIEIGEGTEKLTWLGKMDSGSLKLKVSASIVAISAIHLLKSYMEFNPQEGSDIAETKVMWLLVVHLGFVASALCMAVMDKLERKTKAEHG